MKVEFDTDTITKPLLWLWRSRVVWFLVGAALGSIGLVLRFVAQFNVMF